MKEFLHIDSSSIASILGTVGSPLIVISELIKNAIDSAADNIKINYNRNSQSISVSDDGYGFSLDDIQYLSTPGLSNKKNNGITTNAKGAFYTGSKGLGLLSVFSLCDNLTIQTKNDADGEYVISWSKDTGSYSYEQVIESQMHRGTKISINNVNPQSMTLLTSESEVKKLRHISTYLYKHNTVPFPSISLSIDDGLPNSLLFTTELKNMIYDVFFNYDSKTQKLYFQCFSNRTQINDDKILIDSYDTSRIEEILYQYYNIIDTIKTRTNDNISFRDLEGVEGIPTFEGRLLVYERKTAGVLKNYGSGVNLYINDFALYNYLSEELDWLGLADFSQRKKSTRLKPHNVFGFVNMLNFDETKEQLKISNERADLIQDSVFLKFMYIIKGVIMFMILNIDIAEKNPKYKRKESNPNNNDSNNLQQGKENLSNFSKENEKNNNNSGQNDFNDNKKDNNNSIQNDFTKNEDNEINYKNDKASEQEENYEPESVFKPQLRKKTNLSFTTSEGKHIDVLKNTDNLGNKIYQTIYELNKLNILYYPYATVCLYRTLIESATQYASNKLNLIYQESALPSSICNVLNKWINTPDTSKEHKTNVGLWRDLVNKRKLTDKLNLYIHNVTPVDVDLVLDTWKSMKGYIHLCIMCERQKN